ncbi:signal peptidase II [Amycolatopsis saalfeldensis]|uniref:Lipoprotein signal peptidase n=1 Tax=Amycolatopsis saalfeldensis TaxID=394193 RepID=A0A1H8VSA4_9PSEU|nr:signal peptidase II [Amycolatopsis saalfeldensis]
MDNGRVSTESSSSEHHVEQPAEAPEPAPAEALAPAEPEAEPAAPLPKRRVGLVFAVAVVIWVIDLVTKNLVAANLEGKEPVRILGGLIYLQVIRNPGAAFSMATGMTWVLALVAAAVVVAIIWLSRRLRSIGWAIGLGLVLAGALGNLTDRIFRAPGPLRGHVVDFISAFAPNGEGFAIFNIADSAICCGGVLIVLLSLLGKDYDGTSTRTKKEESA